MAVGDLCRRKKTTTMTVPEGLKQHDGKLGEETRKGRFGREINSLLERMKDTRVNGVNRLPLGHEAREYNNLYRNSLR